MAIVDTQRYFVIPLSVQQEGPLYIVGNTDMGDFYQFPGQGVKILDLLEKGETPADIKSRLAAEDAENVDVDDFLSQLSDIGFIHPESHRQRVHDRLTALSLDSRRTFSADPRIAKAIFSPPILAAYIAVVLYAAFDASEHPELRVNFSAFYIDTNKTLFFAIALALSLVHTVLHELGHMLAAARHGIKSKYGLGNRLWDIVAESDLTGILTLPKSQRYLPMLAGLLVDVLSVALLTLLVGLLLGYGAAPFAVQVVQVLVLEIVIAMAWQFNVFVKTDIYFVISNFLSYPDLDRDARTYLRHILSRITAGRLGAKAPPGQFSNLVVLRVFALVWLFGRILSLLVLFGVFLPTVWRYLASAAGQLSSPTGSVWVACDTVLYISLTLAILGSGMYMWLKQR